MAQHVCAYCGEDCQSTIPLEWAMEATADAPASRVRLNLCERCGRSWAGVAGQSNIPSLPINLPTQFPRRRNAG